MIAKTKMLSSDRERSSSKPARYSDTAVPPCHAHRTPPKPTASTIQTTDQTRDARNVTSSLPRPKTSRSTARRAMTSPPRMAQVPAEMARSVARGMAFSCDRGIRRRFLPPRERPVTPGLAAVLTYVTRRGYFPSPVSLAGRASLGARSCVSSVAQGFPGHADVGSMRPPIRSLRDSAAFMVLAVLLVAIAGMAIATSTVVGGGLGLAAGLTAGVCPAQLLRRPAGHAIGHLVDG